MLERDHENGKDARIEAAGGIREWDPASRALIETIVDKVRAQPARRPETVLEAFGRLLAPGENGDDVLGWHIEQQRVPPAAFEPPEDLQLGRSSIFLCSPQYPHYLVDGAVASFGLQSRVAPTAVLEFTGELFDTGRLEWSLKVVTYEWLFPQNRSQLEEHWLESGDDLSASSKEMLRLYIDERF
jgi:hypothetical protein